MEIAIAIAGLALSVAGFCIGRFASVKAAGREDGEILTEIKHIKSGVDRIQADLDAMHEEHQKLRDRVTRLETFSEIDRDRSGGHV